MVAIVLCAVLAIDATSSAQGDSAEQRYDKAQRYFQHENKVFHCIAQDILEDLIADGETHHALELYQRYSSGNGLPESQHQAFYWVLFALLHGHPDAITIDELKQLESQTTPTKRLLVQFKLREQDHLECELY